MSDTNRANKKLKTASVVISEHLFDLNFQKSFNQRWQSAESHKFENAEIVSWPFRLCKVSNFLQDQDYLNSILQALSSIKTKRNSVDLYQFDQSTDLVETNHQSITTLYESFRVEMVNWMEKNTGIKLNGKISMSSSNYRDTDYLLCHDDKFSDPKLGHRKIAFILYLTKDWNPDFGGSLDLFDTDESGQPRNVIKSLIPELNSFVFFEVTDNSYHQVSEVLIEGKSRLTVSGWFYGDTKSKNAPDKPKLKIDYIYPDNNKQNLNSWISDSYLDSETKASIQKQVEEESYIFLSEFMNLDSYQRVSMDLESESIKWTKVGPANVRNYDIADEKSLPKSLASFMNLFKSQTFFKLLKDYTELDLEKLDESMNPKMSIELQRWSQGCYTLINNVDETEDLTDDCSELAEGSLDVIMQFHTDRVTNYEITIDYVDSLQEDCALIHVPAKENHLCLVYKNQNHFRLQKYVNHYCKTYFYNLVCTYYE